MAGDEKGAAAQTIIRPQAGPQTTFLSSRADIAIYGGAAGGGKTWALLMEPLRHVGNPGFGAVFFRRNLTQVRNEGGLWDESEKLYPHLSATPRSAPDLSWTFPSGAGVAFAHLEHEKTIYNWQGSQIPLICVAKGTPVLMADGTYRPIEQLAAGDLVMTLEGARKITRTFEPRQAQCVRAVVSEADGTVIGDQVHPTDHPVLTPQGWMSYEDALAASPVSSATETRDARKSSSPALMQCRSNGPTLDSLSQDQQQLGVRLQSWPGRLDRSGSDACSASADTDFATSDDGFREEQPQQRLIVPVVLHGPSVRRASSHDHLPRREAPCACDDRALRDCSGRCSADCGQCDDRLPCQRGSGQAYPQAPSDAEAPYHPCCSQGDQARTQSRSQNDLFEYDHPYTKERRSASEVVRLGSCEFVPVGEATVYDIAVDDVNHYVTSSNLVNKNCFDELTHFSAKQFWYMLSRNRSMCGIRPYVRATCNPDADSWVAEFIAWWIDQETGLAIPERAGVLRWFIRIGDTIIWADSPEELAHHTNPLTGEPIPAKSVTFIPAKLSDNAMLMAADPGYLANLMAQPTVERERLLGGNWKIRPAAGLLFQRGWCQVVDAVPAGTIKWMRGWDMAATPKTEGNDPDATAGTKIGRLSDGRYIVAHHCRDWLSPSGVERLIKNTAEADGRDVHISLPQDPGQAGKSQVTNLTKMLAGFNARATPESGDKTTRFSPFSAQAEAGNVLVLRGPWNNEWFAALEGFPEAAHDDDADSTSRAFNALLSVSTYTLSNI